MEKDRVSFLIKKETLEAMRKEKEDTGVPMTRILENALSLYFSKNKKVEKFPRDISDEEV